VGRVQVSAKARSLFGFVLVASSCHAAEASAEAQRSVRLDYARGAGAAECPEEAELESIVSARLGYDPFSVEASRLISVRVARQGTVLVAHLDVESGASRGSRDLASPNRDCRELIDSLAVAIAVGIDPSSLSRAPASPPAPSPLPPPAPLVVAPPIAGAELPKSETPSPNHDPVRLHTGLGPTVSFGAAPSTNLGIAVQAGARWRAISLGIEGRADFPVSRAAVGGGDVSASLLVGSVLPCAHRGIFLTCLMMTFGAMRASGEGVTNPLRDTKFYAAAGGRVGVEIPAWGAVAVGLHGDLVAPLTEITLRLNDRDVWTTPNVSAVLGAGLAGTF
jgi:hypothetical protein